MTGPIEELCLHRVLVAIDGSETSELALRAAITVALRDNAAITLLSVIPEMTAEAAGWSLAGANPEQLQHDAEHYAEKLLRETVDRMPEGVPVTTVIRRGKPGAEICAQARDQVYDGILLGARGVGRVGAMFGSVSSYVLRHADVPVFVAHEPRHVD